MYWHGVLDRLDLFAKGSWFIYLTGSVLFLLSIILIKISHARNGFFYSAWLVFAVGCLI